ncbi:MAG: SRPBCC family protein [Gemmatimonadota bacterium]
MSTAPDATPDATNSTDRFERQLVLDATQSRVWRAITDVSQFNSWFGVKLATPFAPGGESSGQISIRNYEHITMHLWIEALEPERFFSFRWHPNAVDPNVDYSAEPTTLVTFTLEPVDGGTQLTIVESGFDALSVARRAPAFTGNSKGWASQLENIRKFLAARSLDAARCHDLCDHVG